MSSRLNLARRPFVDTRPANVALGGLALLVVVLSIVSVGTMQRYMDESRKTRDSIVSLRAEIDGLEATQRTSEAALGRFNVKEIGEGAANANLIAKRRAFSWTRFLTRLERTLPNDVRVQQITLARGEAGSAAALSASGGSALASESFGVDLDLVSRDPDGMPRLIRAFFGSPFFDDPRPLSEAEPAPEGRHLHVTVQYHDTGRTR